MGKTQSVFEGQGYTVQSNTEIGVVATSKEGDQFVIKEVKMSQVPDDTYQKIKSETDKLKDANHLHIVSYEKTFEDGKCLYIVMDHCLGGNLAQKIQEQKRSGGSFEENQILQWIVQTCMALKCIHERDLLHKDISPQSILLTEFGTICLGGFGELSKRFDAANTAPSQNAALSYISPETLTDGTYDAKSDIWSLGCVLYELCKLDLAFSANTTILLIPKILGGKYPTLPLHFSQDLHQLLEDIFKRDPGSRPAASEILGRPFILGFLKRKTKATVEELQANLDKLKTLADGLEKVHQGTTIGSLTGGVIGLAGGITSIVGLILTPFTLGASLIVTGVGVGVAVAGGVTAGVSNITNMVNESCDRKAIKSMIKEFGEKTKSVETSLQQISQAELRQNEELPDSESGFESLEFRQDEELPDSESGVESSERLARIGTRAGRGLGGIAELVRLVQVGRLGRVAAQTARVVRVAEVATGVLSALFIAVDVFFIAMDAKEIHHIRQAQAQETGRVTDRADSDAELLPNADLDKANIRSETMRFVLSIRQEVEKLQEFVNELKELTTEF